MKTEPTIGNTLYRPVREVICPDTSEATIMPATSGRNSRPAFVGDAPLTICRYSGIEAMPPNMPMPTIVACAEPTAKIAVAEQPQRQQRLVAHRPALDPDERGEPTAPSR